MFDSVPHLCTRIEVEVPESFVSHGAGGWRYTAPARALAAIENPFDFGGELASMSAEKADAATAQATSAAAAARPLRELVDAFRARHDLRISSAITASDKVTLDNGHDRRFVITREPIGLFSVERRGAGIARMAVEQASLIDLDAKTLMRDIIAWTGVQV